MMARYKIVHEKTLAEDGYDFYAVYKRVFFFGWLYLGYGGTRASAQDVIQDDLRGGNNLADVRYYDEDGVSV